MRELRNVIERLMIMVPGDTIDDADVAFLNRDVVTPHVPAATGGDVLPLHDARDASSSDYILRVLAAQQGNMSRTAEALGVERSNLYRKMRAFGIAPAPQGRRGAGVEEDEQRRRDAIGGSHAGLRGPAARSRCSRAPGRRVKPSSCRYHWAADIERGGRHQPDDFALEHRDAVSRRLALDDLEHAEDRRLLVIGQVHRHLHDAAVLERDRPSP